MTASHAFETLICRILFATTRTSVKLALVCKFPLLEVGIFSCDHFAILFRPLCVNRRAFVCFVSKLFFIYFGSGGLNREITTHTFLKPDLDLVNFGVGNYLITEHARIWRTFVSHLLTLYLKVGLSPQEELIMFTQARY